MSRRSSKNYNQGDISRSTDNTPIENVCEVPADINDPVPINMTQSMRTDADLIFSESKRGSVYRERSPSLIYVNLAHIKN